MSKKKRTKQTAINLCQGTMQWVTVLFAWKCDTCGKVLHSPHSLHHKAKK